MFLCQYHDVFIAVALQYIFNSGIVIPPVLLNIVLEFLARAIRQEEKMK
jgi:hypothetical protein